ncbi:MAG: bifunctional diguanylate cyclase/phosphodiesterase [Oscillospiraceae bacterium]|nr:bifunctional diguanylate cyclase/phosphodiesterase [Oscillospiraceae bacterium]
MSTTTQIQKSLDYRVKDLLFELRSHHAGVVANLEDLTESLREMETLDQDQTFFYMDGDGKFFDHGGAMIGGLLDMEFMYSAQREGYAIAAISEVADTDVPGVAILMTVPNLPSYFLLNVMPENVFTEMLFECLTVQADYAAVYNQWGDRVSYFSYTGRPVDDELSQSMQAGAVDFRVSPGDNIIESDYGRNFSAYISLDHPKGWIMGLYIPTSYFMPLFGGMIRASVIAFVSFILLVIAVIGLDVYNDFEKRRELYIVSNMDSLTNLVNAAGMQEAVMNFFKRRPMKGYSLVCMDIMAFHRFNSMFGYSTGDSLLRVVGAVLKNNYECAMRVNGDIFAFIARSAPSLAAVVEDKLNDAVQDELGGQYVTMITFKFGVYPIEDSIRSFREIYDGALLALKNAKQLAKQNEVVYDVELQRNADMQKTIETNMMHALTQKEFLIYIQPQFDAATEKCHGGEALVRWQSEQLGFVGPDQFIPIFENNGFIVEIDFFVLEQVLTLLQNEVQRGKPIQPIAVNQSKVTISFPYYLERIRSIIARYDVPLEYIEIEITESAFENDLDTIIPLMYSLKELGFTLAMDDFGAGFSSLNSLRDIPVDVLKIDKEFLKESDTSERSRKIIRNIINMSKELGIMIICEGVETLEQASFLRDSGCDVFQGFYYSKPLPTTEFLKHYLLHIL